MYQLPRRNLLQKKSTILNTKNSKWVSGLMHIWKTSKRISRNLERHQVYHLGKRTLHHMVYPGHKGHERSAAQPLCSNRVSARSPYPACPALQKWMLPSLWRLSPFASSRNPNVSLPNTIRRCYARELSDALPELKRWCLKLVTVSYLSCPCCLLLGRFLSPDTPSIDTASTEALLYGREVV